MSDPDKATGEDLDAVAALVGVEREATADVITAVITSDRTVTTYPVTTITGSVEVIAAALASAPIERPEYGCTACGRRTADPAEVMHGRGGVVWCPDRLCPGEMVTPPPTIVVEPVPPPDSTAPPDTSIVRVIARTPDGDAHIRAVVVDHREEIRQNTVEVIRELLAQAEAGTIKEFVGIGYDAKGEPALFVSHSDHGRAMGALVMAQSEVVRMWREGGE